MCKKEKKNNQNLTNKKTITGWIVYNFTARDLNCNKSRNKKCK